MDKVTDNSPDVESTESTEGSFPTVGVDTGDTITATLATGTENVGGGGGAFGGASESSAAIHATAKWSTAQLKKHQAEQAARALEAKFALAEAKAQRDALTQRLQDIVNDALRANAARSPSVTDLAHANNMAMQAEAERLRLAKAEQKAREEAEAAEKAVREAERQRDEIARQQAETAHLLAMAEAAEAEKNRLDSLDEEHRAVEVAEKNLAEAKAELAKTESDVQSKQAIVSRVAGELENAQKSVDVKVTGFPGWRDVQKKLERQLQDKKNEYSSVTNALNSAVSIRDAKKTEVQNAEIKLKEAKDALEKSQVKDSVDTMVGFYQYITEQYGEKYTRIAQDLAEKAKGNKFSSVDEALAAFEEYQNVLNKKFSAADRNDIFNALESVNYDEWAKHLEKISKSLKVTGYLSSGYDIVSELLKAKDTGDWKPLFLVIEKQAVDIGIGYVVAVVFSLITGAPLGIFSVAIVTAILCSYLDKDVLNKLNESLGI
ncbi:colicin-10 [Escherichia coli]|uniref:colicin-like pore-forming protein n=1 Tax=Escherichia coli TaxID=562 RepID=UPI000F9794F1|nr:colicin-like pore-forming protein [Escherichia coli]EEC8971505.1 colicin-10 [Escherichia coli]EER1407745.1 colicin-10 [Escherichia coli]EEV3327663.1 colicin-10 [Escherichia coli]EFA1478274.1 colicin-10 [Escherichia coli]EFF5950662.1 colicin-10 [Escherichia coli]